MDREMGVAGRCLGLLHHLFKGLAFEPAAVFAEMSVGLELRAVSSRVGAIIFVHCPTPTLAVHIDQHLDAAHFDAPKAAGRSLQHSPSCKYQRAAEAIPW